MRFKYSKEKKYRLYLNSYKLNANFSLKKKKCFQQQNRMLNMNIIDICADYISAFFYCNLIKIVYFEKENHS